MDQIPVQFKWSRALADASPACKSYLHPTKHLQREREWWGGHLPFNKNVWGSWTLLNLNLPLQQIPQTQKHYPMVDGPSEPSVKVGSGKCRTLHVPLDSRCICLIRLKCQTISQRHNTEQVCRSVWAGHKKGGYSIGIFEGREQQNNNYNCLHCACFGLYRKNIQYQLSPWLKHKHKLTFQEGIEHEHRYKMAPVCLCRHTKTTTQLLFMSFLGLDNVKAGTFSSRFNDTLLDRRKKDADRSNGPIIVRNPTPILYEETLWNVEYSQLSTIIHMVFMQHGNN